MTRLCYSLPDWCGQKLTQAVFALDLIFSQPANAGERSSAVRNGDCHHDFICARRIVDADFHTVEMTANIGGIFVSEGNVQDHTHATAFLRRRDEGRASSEDVAHRCAKLGMKNSGC